MPDGSSQQLPCQRHLCIGSHASSIFASAARLCGSVTVASLHQQLGLAVQSQWRSWPATSSRWLSATVPPSSSPWHSRPAASSRWLFAAAPLASNIFPMALRCSVPAGSPLCRRSPACNSFATAPLPATSLIGAPASNKPHLAEKSTSVWLAICRTWAGFANSQLRCATFHSTYSYKCTSSVLPPCNRCSDIANLSAHLH